jgi:hypothetical protein
MKIASAAKVTIPAAAVAAAIALSGCSPHPAAAPATHRTHVVHTAATRRPARAPHRPAPAATPTQAAAQPPAPATPAPTTAPSAPPSPSAPPAGALTASIDVLNGQNGLLPGGQAVDFEVTVTNHSSQTYSNILPLVSLGHCSCTANTLFPQGFMQERESTSNVWQTIAWAVEAYGMDFLGAQEPGGIQSLSPGGSASFEYRVYLDRATSAQVTRGTANFDVTLVTLPGHHPLTPVPTASAPIDIQAGNPPLQ